MITHKKTGEIGFVKNNSRVLPLPELIIAYRKQVRIPIKQIGKIKSDPLSIKQEIKIGKSILNRTIAFQSNLDITRSILTDISITNFDKIIRKDDRTDNYGCFSLFTKRKVLYEFGLAPLCYTRFLFGRFFINSTKTLNREIYTALIHLNRSKETDRRFGLITAESRTDLINNVKTLKEILRCSGEVLEGVGGFTTEKFLEVLSTCDLTFVFAHGSEYELNFFYKTLPTVLIDGNFDIKTILFLNSCETALDFSGTGNPFFFLRRGIPAIIFPLNRVKMDTAVNLSISMATKLENRVPIALELLNSRRFYESSGKYDHLAYIVFGSPFITFLPNYIIPYKMKQQCWEQVIQTYDLVKLC